jgi:radical SAM protein with 4Fe4S-binding SPASM domain
MSWDLFERLARTYVPSLDYLSLAGGMGEPLLYSRFTDAVRLARSLSDDLILSVSTNALLPGTVRLMRSVAGALSFVQISMDAVGQEFDRIVGRRNVFPVFERTVRELVGVFESAGTKLRFNTVVTPESFEGLSMVVESIAAWGGTYVYMPGMNLAATNLPISRYDFYTAPEYAEAMQKLVETGARLGVTVVWHDMRVVKGFGGCKAPWNNFYIGTDGVLAACCAKPFAALLNFGHVEDGGLAARINDEQLQEFRRHSVLNTTPEFCSSCAVQHTPRPVIPQP